MKKIIISILLVIAFVLVGCGSNDSSKISATNDSHFIISYENEEHSQYIYTLKDKDTGVCYLLILKVGTGGSSITPLYNADGTLKTYK